MKLLYSPGWFGGTGGPFKTVFYHVYIYGIFVDVLQPGVFLGEIYLCFVGTVVYCIVSCVNSCEFFC